MSNYKNFINLIDPWIINLLTIIVAFEISDPEGL